MTFKILDAYTKSVYLTRVWVVVAQDEETKYIVKAKFTGGVPSVLRVLDGLNYELGEMKKRIDFAHLQGKVL